MVGESNLERLARNMNPTLSATPFVYCLFVDFQVPNGVQPICLFRESEGLTAIVEKAQAEQFALPHKFEAAQITLNVHSDLQAVGFLASVAQRLSAADISCNVVSAYMHDHLFVPADRADEAMAILGKVQYAQAGINSG